MSIAAKFVLLMVVLAVLVGIIVYGGAGPVDPAALAPETPASVPLARVDVPATSSAPVAEPASPVASEGPSVRRAAIRARGASARAHVIEMGKNISAAVMPPPPGGGAEVAAAPSVPKQASVAARPSRPTEVIVREGDTCISIASREFGDGEAWQLLVDANPGLNPRQLRIGQRLALPARTTGGQTLAVQRPPKTHRVATGDTLSSLAVTNYGDADRWWDIFEANRAALQDDPDRLRVGLMLTLP